MEAVQRRPSLPALAPATPQHTRARTNARSRTRAAARRVAMRSACLLLPAPLPTLPLSRSVARLSLPVRSLGRAQGESLEPLELLKDGSYGPILTVEEEEAAAAAAATI